MTTSIMPSHELENYLGTSQRWAEELNDENYVRTQTSPEHNEINQGLEPTDGGASAWKLLFGSFLFEAILWGKARN